MEFANRGRTDAARRIELGTLRLLEAGFPKPQTFVAPHDKFSSASLQEVAKRFYLISTGWFEGRHLPLSWWPRYARKKVTGAAHWQMGHTTLLSHPGCLLSFNRPYETMLAEIIATIQRQRVTVLVTHWWEYFRNGQADGKFIEILHQTARYLVDEPSVEVVSFDDVIAGKIPLN
jgi:hypothetical protein